jgi:hypothetical protein
MGVVAADEREGTTHQPSGRDNDHALQSGESQIERLGWVQPGRGLMMRLGLRSPPRSRRWEESC